MTKEGLMRPLPVAYKTDEKTDGGDNLMRNTSFGNLMLLLVNRRLDLVYSARHPAVNWAAITLTTATHKKHCLQVLIFSSKNLI